MDEENHDFYERNFPDKPKPNFSDQAIIYYLEILPINRRSAMLNKKYNTWQNRKKK